MHGTDLCVQAVGMEVEVGKQMSRECWVCWHRVKQVILKQTERKENILG